MSGALGDIDARAVFGPAWAAVQRRHPELPDCAFRVNEGMPGALARAYAPGGWSHRPVLAVEFRPDGMDRPPEDVFGTLLHEAAHMLDWARWGRLSGHSSRFAGFARTLGLIAWRSARPEDFRNHRISARAWARTPYQTEISCDAREVYAAEIAALGEALAPWAEALAAWPCPCLFCDRRVRHRIGGAA